MKFIMIVIPYPRANTIQKKRPLVIRRNEGMGNIGTLTFDFQFVLTSICAYGAPVLHIDLHMECFEKSNKRKSPS